MYAVAAVFFIAGITSIVAGCSWLFKDAEEEKAFREFLEWKRQANVMGASVSDMDTSSNCEPFDNQWLVQNK